MHTTKLQFTEMKNHFQVKLIVGFSLMLSIIIFIFYYIEKENKNYIKSVEWLEHTKEVLFETEQTFTLIQEIELGTRGYIIGKDEKFLKPYRDALPFIKNRLVKLKELTKDNAQQQERMDSLNSLISKLVADSKSQIKLVENNDFAKANSAIGNGFRIMNNIREVVAFIQKNENELYSIRKIRNQQYISSSLKTIYMLEFFVSVILIVVLFIIQRYLKERKKAENDIKKLNDELEQKVIERTEKLDNVNKELNSFTYSVSHDLRAPLRAIEGFGNMLVKNYGDKLDAEANRLMQVVMNNAKKMAQLIDDLLAFSRLGQLELVKINLDMNSVVQNVVTELKSLLENKEIKIEIEKLPNAFGDLGMIKQVLINLISNAIKYSSKKEKAIIQISSYIDGNNNVYVIKDNGAGFDMTYYEKLFGVFQRLHKANEFEGTGVGLSIVQRIVTKHKGKVWAEGIVGEGATFYFSLPREKVIHN